MKISAASRHFGPRQREREKDGIARRNVGDRDAAPMRDRVLSGTSISAVSAEPPNSAQIDVRPRDARSRRGCGYARGGFQFDAMALAVVERERVALVAVALATPRQVAESRPPLSRQTALMGMGDVLRQLERKEEADQRQNHQPAHRGLKCKTICRRIRSPARKSTRRGPRRIPSSAHSRYRPAPARDPGPSRY